MTDVSRLSRADDAEFCQGAVSFFAVFASGSTDPTDGAPYTSYYRPGDCVTFEGEYSRPIACSSHGADAVVNAVFEIEAMPVNADAFGAKMCPSSTTTYLLPDLAAGDRQFVCVRRRY